MPYLVMCKDSRNYRFFGFSESVQLGRAESNHVVLDDLVVSRYHAAIHKEEDAYVLVDQSKNGTFVNEKKIDQCRLFHGTAFQIGDYLFTFLDDSTAERIDEKTRDRGDEDTGHEAPQTVSVGDTEADQSIPLKYRLRREGIVVENQTMLTLYEDVEAVAGINVPVLIRGEPGTGKENVARTLHHRAKVPGKFVPLNCSAIPEGIFESELFGCVKGAFHNASDKPGKLELAENGTIFLDEIGDMHLSLQPKLLRFIEDKEVTRLGDTRTKRIHVRLVAATNQDLEAMMKERTFREDLYHRVCCIRLQVPPLRERQEDILPLTEFFLSKFAKEHRYKAPRISDEAMNMLMEYPWPGNVRELMNVLLSVSVHKGGKTIHPRDLSSLLGSGADGPPLARPLQTIKDMEKEHIVDALEMTGGNKKEAARLLEISRDTLYRKMKKYGIPIN